MTEPTPFYPTPVLTDVDAQTEAWQRANAIAAARSWIGTPYRQLGYVKGPKGCVDCSMLLVAALVESRVFKPFDPRPYSPTWFLHRSEEKYIAWLETIGEEVSAPKPGDIVAYKIGRCFGHSGIMSDENNLVHAYANEGKVIETLLSWPELAKREKRYFDIWARLRKK